MSLQPTVGEIVAITTTDSHLRLLVSTVTDDHVSSVSLADLATETLHRLEATETDIATRRDLAAAIIHAADLMPFTAPMRLRADETGEQPSWAVRGRRE